MNVPPELVARVIDLVHRSSGTRKAKIHIDSDLGRDLGIDGDDASDLLKAFAQEFQVDLSDFKFDTYFGPEAGGNPFVWLIRWLTESWPSFRGLTIRDLAVAAQNRRLI